MLISSTGGRMSTRRLWIIFSVFTTCLSFPSNECLSRGRDGCAVGGAVGTAACEGSAPRSAARRAWALISSTGRRMSARRLRIIFSVGTVSVSSTRAARLRPGAVRMAVRSAVQSGRRRARGSARRRRPRAPRGRVSAPRSCCPVWCAAGGSAS